MEKDDYICSRCVDEEGLKDHIRREGEIERCTLCKRKGSSITLGDLASLVDPILREHFRWGPEEKVFDGPDDDHGRWEQQGQDLDEVVAEVVGGGAFHESLVQTLIEDDPADRRDGEDPFFSDWNNYVETPTDTTEHVERWNAVSEELRQRRRFFSEAARDLFDWLFEDVEVLRGLERFHGDIDGVVRELPTDAKLFRARSCESTEEIRKIIKNPTKELGPPPPDRARAGRMNAAGIPVFYGALELDTCIAEMRAPLGGRVAIGTFAVSKPVRILDFGRLEVSFRGPLSYFDPEFSERVKKNAFLGRLHRLVRAPVLPGHEDEYLITQAMAEYLAHVRAKPFDGVIFTSAQRRLGNNVVLFPANFRDVEIDALPGSGLLKSIPDVVVHKITKVKYSSQELNVYEDRGGEIQIYDLTQPDADD